MWHDPNGNMDSFVNNTYTLPNIINSDTCYNGPSAPIPTNHRILLVNPITNAIIKLATINTTTNTFVINNVVSGQNYNLVLSQTPITTGIGGPLATLPLGWVNTGENLGIAAGNDGAINGILNLTVANTLTNIVEANFGIVAPCSQTLINISGYVWHDVNGLTDSLVNNSGALTVPAATPIPAGLRMYLVSGATHLIVKSTVVSANSNTFSFTNIPLGPLYYLKLSNSNELNHQ